jgi:hypothetical protein
VLITVSVIGEECPREVEPRLLRFTSCATGSA